MRHFLTAFFICFFVINSVGSTRRGSPPATSPIEIAANGAVSPQSTTIRLNDTAKWRGLGTFDSIVRLPDSYDGVTDPCDAPAHTYSNTDANEFTGPVRLGVPGIFVRGPSGTSNAGPEIIDCTPASNCSPNPCDNDPSPIIVGDRAYCGSQNATPQYLPDEMWGYTWLGGDLLIINWDEIETADGVYSWTALDHELTAASESGKMVNLSISVGEDGTPAWLFDPPVNAVEVNLRGNNSNSFSPYSGCGSNVTFGSPFDAAGYVAEINEFIVDTATHINSDAALRQVLAGWQIMGVNAVSDEFKTFSSCPDDFTNSGDGHTVTPEDNILDSYEGNDCLCNSKVWAENGWTPEAIALFVSNQLELVQDNFGDNIVVRYGLIQAGLPKVKDSTNFKGDKLRDPTTLLCLYDPDSDNDCLENATNDNQQVASSDQVDGIIASGKASGSNPNAFWAMHFGLGRYPTEDESNPAPSNCTFGGTVDLINEVIEYPIPLAGPVGSEPQCPNGWANNTTISPPAAGMSGFQTNNSGNGIDTPADVESVLLHMERNTNALYLEIYAAIGFYLNELVGGSGDIDPTRDDLPTPAGIDPEVGYTKSAESHVHELVERRDGGTFTEADVFPSQWTHQFSVAGTYYFYNPRTCSTIGTGSWGKIIVNP